MAAVGGLARQVMVFVIVVVDVVVAVLAFAGAAIAATENVKIMSKP